MRRIVVLLSSLLAATAALVGTASAAFAVSVAPASGGSPVLVAPTVHHSGGLEPWQVALIAFAAVLVLASAAIAGRVTRVLHRPAATPATS